MNPFRASHKTQGIRPQNPCLMKQTDWVCLQNTYDYSPFGVSLDGRTVEGDFYRYGFQKQEKDDEIVGKGKNYTADFWQFDTHIARRWNCDPVVKPHESPFVTFANNPVCFIDPNGLDTSLTAQSRELILDLINVNSINYNEKFSVNFQKLVDDRSTVYMFNQWDHAKKEANINGGNDITYGEFSPLGKNLDGQNLVSIGYSMEFPSQGNKLDALFEEFDHANQFLNQRIGFHKLDNKWHSISYDFYDEVDNKIARVKYLNSFKDCSVYKAQLYGTNSKILLSDFSRSAAERIVRLHYNFKDEQELNVFDAFDNPKEAKVEFNNGVRWENILIGGK